MKTSPASLQDETTTFAVFWKIERRDGVVQGFTSHVQDISYNDGAGSVVYKAATGIVPSNIASSVGKGIDNLQIVGIINSSDIDENDIMIGKYDDAKVTIFLHNYENLLDTPITLIKGYIGEVTLGRASFEAEVRSLIQRASQAIGKACSPLCRVKVLGDGECGVNLAGFTFTNQTVQGVVSRSIFRSASAGVVGKPAFYFAYGTLTWTSGPNSGKSVEVRSHNTSNPMEFTLAEPMPFPIGVGNQFTIVAGCDRRLETCRDKFANVLNFRGEPYIPGADAVLRKVSS